MQTTTVSTEGVDDSDGEVFDVPANPVQEIISSNTTETPVENERKEEVNLVSAVYSTPINYPGAKTYKIKLFDSSIKDEIYP